MKRDGDVLVIGGGVIGVCVAYYLTEAGRHVTLLDKDEICSGCSRGNAGLVVPSHSIPLASPGALRKALKWMLEPDSPFYVKPRIDLELLSWLWRFGAACNKGRMRKSIPITRDLNRSSKELFDELVAAERLDVGYTTKGLLELFVTEEGYREGAESAELLREFGIEAEPLDATEVREMEPGVAANVIGGVFCPADAHIDPARFVTQLAQVTESRGADIRTSTEVLGFKVLGGSVTEVETTRGSFRPRCVVLAAGAWSGAIAKELGVRLPVQAAKGYAVNVARPDTSPAIPLLLGEAKVAVTPLADILRFSGTLELAGIDLSITRRRVAAIRRVVRHYHRCHEVGDVVEIWRGLRPCMPDGLPAIGRCAPYENVIVATGHAMKGVCQGPITGRLVADLVCDESPALDLSLVSPQRF